MKNFRKTSGGGLGKLSKIRGDLNHRGGCLIFDTIKTEYILKCMTAIYTNNISAVWSRKRITYHSKSSFWCKVVLLLSPHYISHYAMTQKGFFVSDKGVKLRFCRQG